MDDCMQEFEKLYLQGNAKEAFDLRQKHLPPKLYRYRSCQSSKDLHRRVDEMKGFIHFSDPSELNELFAILGYTCFKNKNTCGHTHIEK